MTGGRTPRSDVAVAAVDLGASSGRVMLARIGPDELSLHEAHRFRTPTLALPTGLHWDLGGIFREVCEGLRAAARALAPGERLAGVGIDSWAVDYGLIDRSGALVGLPFCYRDARGDRGLAAVHERIDPRQLYRRNGIQQLPLTTVYQLAAEPAERLAAADRLLLIPDLLNYWLTGQLRAEVTNASTTGLLDPRTRQWDTDLAEQLDLPGRLLAPLVRPGERVGGVRPEVAERIGVPAGTPVLAVASHDTASAVAAVPATDERFAYISSGTWSLVGAELDGPLISDAGWAAGWTNEAGLDGRTRFLRNVTGLWLLTESLRVWRQRTGERPSAFALLEAAERLPAGGPVIDVDEPAFRPPGDMPSRIEAACRRTGQPVPDTEPAVVRCILDSLAAAYARSLAALSALTGTSPQVVHVVGGGSRNGLLARLTARAVGLPVACGPAEATALGNAMVQAAGLGAVSAEPARLRAHVARHHPPDRFEGTGDGGAGPGPTVVGAGRHDLSGPTTTSERC